MSSRNSPIGVSRSVGAGSRGHGGSGRTVYRGRRRRTGLTSGLSTNLFGSNQATASQSGSRMCRMGSGLNFSFDMVDNIVINENNSDGTLTERRNITNNTKSRRKRNNFF